MVFSYLVRSLMHLQGGALYFIMLLLLAVVVSNFMSVMVTYPFNWTPFVTAAKAHAPMQVVPLEALWLLPLKPLMGNESGLFEAGLLMGLTLLVKPMPFF